MQFFFQLKVVLYLFTDMYILYSKRGPENSNHTLVGHIVSAVVK